MTDLDFSNIVPNWRGDEHLEEFQWSEDMEHLYPRDELLEEGSIADWGMLVDTCKRLKAEGKPITEKAVLEGINKQVLKAVEDACAKFESMGLGRELPDGSFEFFEPPIIADDDKVKDFPADYRTGD